MARRIRSERPSRRDDRGDLEGGVVDVKRAVVELTAKLDQLLAAPSADIDVRDTTTTGPPDPEAMSTPGSPTPGFALIEDCALIEGSAQSPGAALIGDSALIGGSDPDPQP